MIQADYQLALLLQREFVAESERKSSDTLDYNMALMLQNHFEHETNIDSPKNNLVYDRKSSRDGRKDDTRSLVDPSWELIDPTPNIHTLFVAFSGRFFWNMLQSVSVAWSKRMTSCAGVCTYNPGGMCVITLSEPLLKLRPRKDLVETLLHEMIHAYLFVTHNNRDRDGHGPEFHKHMYRINKDAGTNITVYHSFHDEVRLYQQHWWRCNGPCQNRKPFFGIVRRATNRAPGPNDRWWNEHARTCAGTFIKIREPEKTKAKLQTEKKNTEATKKPNRDIRSFVEVWNGKNKQIENDKNINNKSNIKSFENSKDNNSKVTNLSSNIVGFANLNKSLNRMRSNSNSTIVVTKKPTTSTNLHTNNIPSNVSNKTFQGTGQILQVNAPVKSNDYSVVRNRWLNKFDLNTAQTGNKRIQNDVPLEGGDASIKKTKLTNPNDDPVVLEESVECPVCVKKIPISNLNNHLDKCLELQSEAICIICGKKIPGSQLSNHQSNCFDKNFAADDSRMQKCEICNILIEQSHKEEHMKVCLGKIFNSEMDSTAPQASFIECQVCNEMIDSGIIEKHTDLCLHKMFNEIEDRAGLESSNILVLCLVCNKKVRRSELNTHLDECMKDVFDNKNEFIEIKENNKDKQSKSDCDSEKERSYNCPFCLELYSEFDMCAHIDECLASGKCKTDDKSVLIDSFINDDF